MYNLIRHITVSQFNSTTLFGILFCSESPAPPALRVFGL